MKDWRKIPELGPVLGMRILVGICTLLGRGAARLLLRIIVAYYFIFAVRARRASRDYLKRASILPSARNVYAHLFHFAQVSLDRIYFITGNLAPFTVTCTGNHHLLKLRDAKKGGILLGAHVGSFDAMRAVSELEGLRLSAVGYFKNAEKVNALLDEYGNNSTTLVHVEPDSIGYLLKIKDLIDEGHLVALLADREMGGPTCEVEILGGRARLPIGPYALSAQLDCPILVTFGLFSQPAHYDLYCEPLGSIPAVGRKERDAVYQHYGQQYAHLIEKYCQKAPFNWFNFYDYWI